MQVDIYTDGSCLGNPGPGAWAYLIRVTPTGASPKEHREQGGEPYTTNNRMELSAVIEAFKWMGKNHPDEKKMSVYSDSTWVISTLTKNWKKKKNLDLWEALAPLLVGKQIQWNWVRGHNGHKENEDCDVRAQREANLQAKNASKRPTSQGGSPTLFD